MGADTRAKGSVGEGEGRPGSDNPRQRKFRMLGGSGGGPGLRGQGVALGQADREAPEETGSEKVFLNHSRACGRQEGGDLRAVACGLDPTHCCFVPGFIGVQPVSYAHAVAELSPQRLNTDFRPL